MAELAEIATTALRVGAPSLMSADTTDRVAELTVERMTRQGYEDDVTLLAVRLTGQPVPEFAADLPAEPGQLSVLRGRLEDWLIAVGASEADIASIEIGVLEAVTNAVEHAYDEPGGRVRVEASLDEQGRACVTVIDDGCWLQPAADPGRRGRGLLMMRACMDTVELETAPTGTTVLLDRRLQREPVVDLTRSATRSIPRQRSATIGVTVSRSMRPTITLTGPLDLSTAEELRRHLWTASRGGALPLTVELGGVTHLGSAGIQVLYEFVEEMSAEGRELHFVVPPGCPAAYAVQLSDLTAIAEFVAEPPLATS